MKVIDPTINSLSVRWDPAVGHVRNYKVFYIAQPDGKEQMVRLLFISLAILLSTQPCLHYK